MTAETSCAIAVFTAITFLAIELPGELIDVRLGIMQLRQWQIRDDLWPMNDLFYSLNQLNQSSSVFH